MILLKSEKPYKEKKMYTLKRLSIENKEEIKKGFHRCFYKGALV